MGALFNMLKIYSPQSIQSEFIIFYSLKIDPSYQGISDGPKILSFQAGEV